VEEGLVGLVVLGFGLAVVALLTVTTTRSAAEGHLERNGAIGIRTRHTRASDEAWRAGHSAALPVVRYVVHVAVAAVLAAVVAAVLGGPVAAVVVGLAGMGVQVAVLVLGARRANEAARAAGA
jgi:hypothetical protein